MGQLQRFWLLQQLLSVCLLLGLAAADVQTLSQAVLGELPIWSQNRSADIVLDFRKADPNFKHPSLGTIRFRGQDLTVRYHIGYYHGNVAIVRFGTKFFIAVRKMHFFKTLRTQIEAYPLSKKPGKSGLLHADVGPFCTAWSLA
jgi:hypothetical protein